jgi:hypothetical protein
VFGGFDFGGIDAMKKKIQTPLPMATPRIPESQRTRSMAEYIKQFDILNRLKSCNYKKGPCDVKS